MDTDNIVKKAQSLLGTKFRHQGRDERGIDCAGLISVCMQAGGADLGDFPPLPVYKKEPKNTDARLWLSGFFCPVLNKDKQAGDVALMKYNDRAVHLGIYTGDSIIHAATFARKVIEEPVGSVIDKHVCGFFRVKEK